MSSDDAKGIIWSPTEYKLKFVLDNFPLPQVVEVVQGYLISDEDSIASGQILTLHGQKKIEKLVGLDGRNVELNIPVNCPYKVRIRAPNDDKIYPTVKDLCNCTPLPKCVEISDKPEFTNSGLRKGDKLLVERIETNFHGEPKGILFLTVESTRSISLPMHALCQFRPCPLPCDTFVEYFIKDLVEQRSLPLCIEFLPHDDRDTPYQPSLGVIHASEVFATDIVLASSRVEGVNFAMTFPIDLPITIKVAQGMLDNSDSYARICQEFHESVDLRRFENLTLSDPYVTGNCFYGIYDELPTLNLGTPLLPHHPIQWTPPSTRRRSNPSRSSSSLDSEDSEDRKNRKAKKNNLKSLLFKNRKIPETQATPGKSTLPSTSVRGTSRHANDNSNSNSPYLMPYHINRPFRENHVGGESDCSDNENYDEIAHCMDNHYYRRISGATRDSSKSSTDSGVSLPTKSKIHRGSPSWNGDNPPVGNKKDDENEKDEVDTLERMVGRVRTTEGPDDQNYFLNHDHNQNKGNQDGRTEGTLESSLSVDTTKSTTSTDDGYRNMQADLHDYNDDKVSSTNSATTDPLTQFDPADSRTLARQLVDYDPIVSPAQSIKSAKEEILCESEEGVCDILEKLKLSAFKDSFRKNQINGELLVELDIDDLVQSLGLTLFEAVKLECYIDGWRPDDIVQRSQRTTLQGESVDTDVFCSVESLKDLESNCSSWTVDEVYSRMASINLVEFGIFCKENQVNGELLKACLNRKALASIKNDYKITLTPLNEKKLANYVLKGWRPDLQCRTRQGSPANCQ